ncbi:hypothetical protein H2203_000264 [Taxawa tesnikishii (nom. ined.)]|nr:hypothetical protein H2203_000264 [Dothideales sp. JES 119]
MNFAWTLLLLNAQAQSTGINNGTSADHSRLDIPPSSSVYLSSTQSTCGSGTVNYITHALPQQCLASSRPGVSTSSGSSGTQDTASRGTYTNSTPAAEPSSGSQSAPPIQELPAATSNPGATGITTSNVPEQPTVVTSTVTTPASTIGTEEETETDSPLDNANFLSFEEWKKQNLAKAGQSPEHVGQQRSSGNKQGRQRPGINNALDVLGEDTEIELDFSGFGGGSRSEEGGEGQKRTNEANPSASGRARTEISLDQVVRSKDAGKTCKERTNYASFDCAATVLKTNPECKSASSVLIENKDSYMLNPCGVSNKFLIVELCNDILIDTVVLANYEFFSSIFRTFRVSVSDRYPVKPDRWKELGVFEARNSRGVQAF